MATATPLLAGVEQPNASISEYVNAIGSAASRHINVSDPCAALQLMKPGEVVYIPQTFNPRQSRYEIRKHESSCEKIEGSGVAFPLGVLHWDAVVSSWLCSVALDSVNLFSQANFCVALVLDKSYMDVDLWCKCTFIGTFLLMLFAQTYLAVSFVRSSGTRKELLMQLWESHGFWVWSSAMFNFVLLRFFYEPNLIKDVKWWLKNSKGEAPNHDTPILVARHYSTFCFENHAAWSVKVVPSILQNSILFGINLYVTFGVLGTFTSVSLFMASVTLISGLKTIHKIFFVWLPSAKNHIKNQERRVRSGDIANTIAELNHLKNNMLIRFLNFACWRMTTWGPYPKACISFDLDGTECIALLFAEQPPHQNGFSHTIQYLSEGDSRGIEAVVADEDSSRLERLNTRGNVDIGYQVLQRPHERGQC